MVPGGREIVWPIARMAGLRDGFAASRDARETEK